MKICAIHQPNFFPWLGYFDKIQKAEIFVFLDQVAYPKSGSGSGSWVNRVRLSINNTPAWVGCPIRREHGVQIIKDVYIDDRQPWRKKLLRTIELNYCKTKNYMDAMEFLIPLIMHETDNLAQFNMHAIRKICQMLTPNAKFICQSDLKAAGRATELLINILKEVGADVYLCGGGASDYQEDHLFAEHGINLVYQNFTPSAYGDEQTFIPGLSIIDYLMKR